MFVTPYVRRIWDVQERIWQGHEDSFFWEPEGEIGRLNDRLNEELRRCRDDEYSDAHYTTGPAVEWIEEAKRKYPELCTIWERNWYHKKW